MKKLNKNIFAVLMIVIMLIPVGMGTAKAYTIDTTYQLTLNEGDSRRAVNKFIILHEVGTESSAVNNAIYMKRAWSTNGAYTQFIVGDGGKVYKVGEDGYVSWGAGSYVNANAPVQIELARTFSAEQFKQDYAAYVNLARDYAIKYGIPLTLDDGNMYTNGIKSHLWVTQNVWGDHTDPYGYLARFGVSKEKLAADLRTGINAEMPITEKEMNVVKIIGLADDTRVNLVPQMQKKYSGTLIAEDTRGVGKGLIELRNILNQANYNTIYNSLINDYKIPTSQIRKVDNQTIHVFGLADDTQVKLVPDFQKRFSRMYLANVIHGNATQTIEINSIPDNSINQIKKSIEQDFKIPSFQIK
ncbi:peptidoglycan recognition protein family protein [Carnobacterium maltaromaticum]